MQFADVQSLREHYHTDWYRYNLKRSARGQPPIGEDEFDRLVEQATAAPDRAAAASDRAAALLCHQGLASLTSDYILLTDRNLTLELRWHKRTDASAL